MRWRRLIAVSCLAACASADAPARKKPSDGSDPTTCEAEVAPRQLRLLTRREYNATIRDLLGVDGAKGASCDSDEACDLLRASCVGGTCLDDPCSLHAFALADDGYQSVDVAGSFNDWNGTALSYVPSLDSWVGKIELPNGRHSYKLVIDGETWLSDPTATETEPDGFGGLNSVVELACDPDVQHDDNPAADFPIESRPEGYFFDNHADAGLVTATHVERYMRAAETIAAAVAGDLGVDALADFAARAFRRPLTQEESGRYIALAQAHDVAAAVEAILSSASFLYRSEIGDPSADVSRLTDHEIASALSYSLWGTMPDEALRRAADTGTLDIENEARRMLDDPRAAALVGEMAIMWLGVERVVAVDKNSTLFPAFDDALARAMLDETTRFVADTLMTRRQPLSALWLAGETVATGDLAALYGAVDGRLPEHRHAGVLAHGSVLASYAHSDQTSPVRRGLFVRERLLCQTLGAPPPDAAAVPSVDPDSTARERFAQHSEDPACAGCHDHIDPVGFGFERFDAIGRHRDEDGGVPIDDSGLLTAVEGFGSDSDAPFASLPELARIIADSERAGACFAEQTHAFVMGRAGESAGCEREVIAARFAASGYDVRELIVAVVTSDAFAQRGETK